jgi:hypothetical protein
MYIKITITKKQILVKFIKNSPYFLQKECERINGKNIYNS